MLNNSEPLSAFAVYSQLYKSEEPNTNKRKNKRSNSKSKKQKISHEQKTKPANGHNKQKSSNVDKTKQANGNTNNKQNIGNESKTKKVKSNNKHGGSKENKVDVPKMNVKPVDNIKVTNSTPSKADSKVKSKVEAKINKDNLRKASSIATKQQTKQQSLDISASPISSSKKNNKRLEIKAPKPAKKSVKPNLQKCSSGYFYVDNFDSVKAGEQMFSWVMHPIEIEQFFKENWEQQPIIVQRKCPKYYSNILTCEDIDKALRKQQLYFTKNIDITSYSPETGLRETHNPPGRATAPLVWDFYANGCSVRILNPQTFFPKVHALNAALQEYFGCFVGANVYLTPADSQGFAPHYDDIEAFVIQLEGEKLWRLYAPRNSSEVLPRFSSGNFTDSDLGDPIQEVLLKQGDVMYFPRGFIHQGVALGTTHSLHITLSVYQKNSWADLLEVLLPAALKTAIEEDVSFRKGLPLNFLSNLGLVHSDKLTKSRAEFMQNLQNLMSKLIDYAPVDAAVDQVAKKFIHDSLPPFLREEEKETTIYSDGERIKNGEIQNQAEMCLATRIKLIRYNCIRMLREEDTIRIYHSVSNSKEYHEEEAQFLEIDEDLAPAVDALIHIYPEYISVESLPINDDIQKVQIASDLWECGILKTAEPLSYESD